uniref:Ovule protein n=1 Tax=Heterorhabditis bacteriophora TaxID=37862 RepID=A0A1I7WPP5_HETBA
MCEVQVDELCSMRSIQYIRLITSLPHFVVLTRFLGIRIQFGILSDVTYEITGNFCVKFVMPTLCSTSFTMICDNE